MLKMHADIVEAGLPVDYDMIAAESSCAHNCLLTHHGVTPSLGVLGNIPRELYEIDNESQDAVNANSAMSYAVRYRSIAKAACLQAVAERRFSLANRTNNQQQELDKFVPGAILDLYRPPSSKDTPGWRGPAVLIELDRKAGSVVLKWQGRIYNVPLRPPDCMSD